MAKCRYCRYLATDDNDKTFYCKVCGDEVEDINEIFSCDDYKLSQSAINTLEMEKIDMDHSPVKIEERKGRWIGTCQIGFGEFTECEIKLEDGFVTDNCHCSECGEELEKGERGIYCPMCGTKMKGTED